MDPSVLGDFFDLCNNLKKTKRTGWVYRGVEDPESIADHSWRVALMAFFIEDPFVDKVHCMKMGLIHDLAESIVGDITPVDNVSEEDKYTMEHNALVEITKDFPKPLSEEIIGLWEEYEAQETTCSHYVFDFDKLDMLIQANQYEKDQGRDLQEFFDSTAHRFKTPYGISQIKLLSQRREERMNASKSDDKELFVCLILQTSTYKQCRMTITVSKNYLKQTNQEEIKRHNISYTPIHYVLPRLLFSYPLPKQLIITPPFSPSACNLNTMPTMSFSRRSN